MCIYIYPYLYIISYVYIYIGNLYSIKSAQENDLVLGNRKTNGSDHLKAPGTPKSKKVSMKLPKESKLREDFASMRKEGRKVFKKNLSFNLCLKQGRGYKAQSSVSLRKALAIRLNRTFFCRIFLKKISPLNWT